MGKYKYTHDNIEHLKNLGMNPKIIFPYITLNDRNNITILGDKISAVQETKSYTNSVSRCTCTQQNERDFKS